MSRLELALRSNQDRLRIMFAVWQSERNDLQRVIDSLNAHRPMTRPETRVLKNDNL